VKRRLSARALALFSGVARVSRVAGFARVAAAGGLAWIAGAATVGGLAPLAARAAHAQVTSAEQLRYPPLPRFDIPQPQRVVLDNGLVVMLIEDHELPLVTLTALLRTGSRTDPPAKLGLAEIAGDMMRTAGIARPARRPAKLAPSRRADPPTTTTGEALDEQLESHAATLEVNFGEDSGSATLSVLKDDFARLLPLLAGVLRYPAFDAAKLGVSRDFAKQRLERQNDEPDTVVWREFARLVYGPLSVYGRTPTFATIDAISRADLVAWHRRNIHPDRMVLGLAGDFRSADALAAVRAAFGDWPRGPAAAAPAPAGPEAFTFRGEPNPGLFVIDKSDMSQSEVIMGHLGVVKSDPDYCALQVLNEVLSGSFASRLMAHVRTEKGLAYAVDGGIGSEWDHPGLATLGLSTKVSSTADGVAALLAEARGLIADPPSDEEVARAKQSILASFVFHSDSPAKVLSQHLSFELYGYPLDWLERYRAGVEAVTADGVRQAAARHLHADQFTVLVLGPAESTDRSLAPFGKPTVLPLTAAAHTQP
jgi:zinc protease